MKKWLAFVHEIGTIMYVGGILSHIVIGTLFGHQDPEVTVTVYTYKEFSAYVLILPGLALKIATDLTAYLWMGERQWWMKIKIAMTVFLTGNAFIFLVPMMPELLLLAEMSVPSGALSEAFLALESREQLIGMSNVLPLLTEMTMGAFRPRLFGERRVA